jgi:hypothetical protein
MGLAGRKPKEDRTLVRNRNTVADWTEYPNVPFEDGPPLSSRPQTASTDDPNAATRDIMFWPAATKRWWKAISRMPHAVAWSETDWEFATATAEIHARFVEGWKGASGAELRMREKLMGVYADARRDLRIRYVDPPTAAERRKAQADAEGVAHISDYRKL